MTDDKKMRVQIAPGVLESLDEEERAGLLQAAAAMQAELDLGGVDALQLRAVRFVNMATARCEVCRGVLTRDADGFPEYECKMTSACRHYVYVNESTPEAKAAMEAYDALPSRELL